MPDMIGNIAVPEIAASGVFPLTPDYPIEVRRDHEVVIHQFGSGNAKIEQRFLLGTGTRRFSFRKQWLRDADRIALRNFWETKYGPYGAFTFSAPNDGGGTTSVTCRFANEPLSWEMVADWACALGVTLIEIPTGKSPVHAEPNRQSVPAWVSSNRAVVASTGDHPAGAHPAAGIWISRHSSVRPSLRNWWPALPGTAPGIRWHLAVDRKRVG